MGKVEWMKLWGNESNMNPIFQYIPNSAARREGAAQQRTKESLIWVWVGTRGKSACINVCQLFLSKKNWVLHPGMTTHVKLLISAIYTSRSHQSKILFHGLISTVKLLDGVCLRQEKHHCHQRTFPLVPGWKILPLSRRQATGSALSNHKWRAFWSPKNTGDQKDWKRLNVLQHFDFRNHWEMRLWWNMTSSHGQQDPWAALLKHI